MKRIIGTVVCLVAILIVLANSYHTISDTSNVPPLDVTQVAQPAATAEQTAKPDNADTITADVREKARI